VGGPLGDHDRCCRRRSAGSSIHPTCANLDPCLLALPAIGRVAPLILRATAGKLIMPRALPIARPMRSKNAILDDCHVRVGARHGPDQCEAVPRPRQGLQVERNRASGAEKAAQSVAFEFVRSLDAACRPRSQRVASVQATVVMASGPHQEGHSSRGAVPPEGAGRTRRFVIIDALNRPPLRCRLPTVRPANWTGLADRARPRSESTIALLCDIAHMPARSRVVEYFRTIGDRLPLRTAQHARTVQLGAFVST
jgi:hypothetical protein